MSVEPKVRTAELVTRLLGGERICIADVGAADGLAKRWRPLAPALRVIAFEPDARSDASPDTGADVTVVNRAAAAHEGPAPFFLTRKPRCSSLFAPNRAVIDRYPDAERYDVQQESTVECTTIDAALAPPAVRMDFLKIDTQGTELNVLRGAGRSLADCLGIEVEVEFQPLYAGSALFRDIDRFVSEQGFEIFDVRRTFFTRSGAAPHIPQRKGQLVFGDALYFRNWESLGERLALVKLAVLMLTYGFADVVMQIAGTARLLSSADRQTLGLLCDGLRPVAGVDADRKDRFVGTGLQLI